MLAAVVSFEGEAWLNFGDVKFRELTKAPWTGKVSTECAKDSSCAARFIKPFCFFLMLFWWMTYRLNA